MIRKTYDVIGPLSREQRMLARTNTPEVPQVLTRETLREKAGTPNALEELKTLITAGSTARAERVKRAQEAAEMAGGATTAEMADTEKKAVIEASRQIIQEAIEQVAVELRGATVEATRAALEKEQGKISESKERVLQIETSLATLAEKLKIGGREVARDMSKGNWSDRLLYGGIAVGGMVATKWLWDHTIGYLWDKTIGDEEKPGFLRKLAGALAAAGGGILAAIGLKLALQSPAGSKVRDVGEHIKKGADEGVEQTKTVFQETFGDRWENFRESKDWLEWVGSGGDLVLIGSTLYFVRQGKYLVWDKGGEVLESAKKFLAGDQDGWEAGCDVLQIYAAGIPVYATSFGVIDFLATKGGLMDRLKVVGGRSFAWPYQMYRKTGMRYAVGYLAPTAHGQIVRIESQLAFRKMKDVATLRGPRLGAVRALDVWKTAHIDDLHAEWKAYNALLAKLPIKKEAEAARMVVLERMRLIEERMKSAMESVCRRTGQVPKFVEELNNPELIRQIRAGQVDPAHLQEKLKATMRAEDLSTIEKSLAEGTDVAMTGRTADGMRATAREIQTALANSDDIATLLKKGTLLSELLEQAKTADEYARIARVFGTLKKAERIGHLRSICGKYSIETLQGFGLADNMDDVAKAVAQLDDIAARGARLKELLMLGMKQEQLLAAGAQMDEVARAVKAVASATDDTVRGSGKMGAVTAAVHGQSTPATGTSTLPKPAPAAAAATSGDDAARVARESVAALENGALLKHAPTRLLLERNPEEAARVLQIAQKANGIAGAKRAARYMLALADDVDASRRAAMFSPEVLEIVAKGDNGNPAAIARFLGRVPAKAGTELTSDALANAIKQMTRWQRAGTAMRTLYVAGAAVEVGMVAWDTYNLVDAVGERKKQREALGEALRKAGLTSADGETYTGCGVEVSLTEVEDTDVEEYAARVAVGAGALGFTLLAPSLCLGPVGLVVAGVVIAAHVTIGGVTNAFEQRKHQEFLMKAPHWLLTMLGTQTTIRQSEHETMREYTGVMSQDIWPSSWTELALAAVPTAGPAMLSIGKSMTAGDVETMRKNLREKLLQSISFRALAHGYPELLTELPGMQEGLKSFMDPAGEFLRAGGDYERIVRPYIVLRLHGHTEGEGVAFRQTNLLDLTDNKGGWFDGSWLGMEVPTVDQYDLERAVEEAMLFYVHHMREKRYRAAAKHLETLAGEEEKRLATQTTLTESQRAEKLHSYREALQTALAEEVEENKDMFYVLNRKPSDLPTYPDGKTFTEHMLEERFRHVESTSADTSARAASTGWRSPASGTEMNIGSFAEVYLRPAFREQDGTWLKKNSPPRGEPFSFDELNVEMGMTDEEFAATFRQKIAPAQEVDKALTRVMDTEEDMKACVENLGEKIDFHQKLHRYRGYYNTYLRRWRPNLNMHIPEGPPLAKTLKTWRDRGYPRLIPQEFFAQWRTRAKNRSTALPENTLPILQQGRQALRLPQMEGVAMQFHIPGLDLSKEGTRVYSYDGYWTEMQRVTTGLAYEQDGNIFTEILLRQQTGGAYPFLAFRNASALNRYRPTPDPFAVWRRMQVERNDRNRTRAFGIRPREEPEPASQMYIDASGKPRSLIEYTQKKDVVAVTPMELEQLLRELGILAQPMPIISPRPSMQRIELLPPVYNDEFKPLREYLVRSRILVTVDPMPTQQQLPLHLLR
ncbi:MAG: hypothetical protein PHO92_01495 [Candidatus Peribacteraceae bacterium]|nr:hypothetical protein [Candidatus Peribacteraceae bacterium]